MSKTIVTMTYRFPDKPTPDTPHSLHFLRRHRYGCALLSLLLLLLEPEIGSSEPRRQISATSPAVLMSVGRLLVPGRRFEEGHQRHCRESCSATLLASADDKPASLILTAWHCLEHHTDLTDDITFAIRSISGASLRRLAKPMSSGGGMRADWALMRLQEPIPVAMARGATLSRGGLPEPDSAVIMAGYSRDSGLGGAGKVLTFHRDCRVLAHSDNDIATDCLAYRGASGGAVFSANNDRLLGVISRGDSRESSIFVPLSRIPERLKKGLAND